ncbi:N-acetyltransferase [Edaphobacter acidisoli]|uniref:N-acetyltransferase n=1 Tax=Edaphobacter acidisoli TaxID=2040573 RepID=A0A916W258_9BACT|nr:GNAT family protein [Edaphobacter acidisoli]GGA60249.1 N-acetyltransferase [Edaphobacter acidisoli]
MPPTLEGRKVRLEPMTLAHIPALEKIAFDDRIWRYMTHPVKTPADLRAWVEASLQKEAAGTDQPWVTVLKSTNRVIGSTRFLDFDHEHRTTELGNTWLAPEFHGAGINPEAKLLQLTYAFEQLNLNRVALKTHHENLQSQTAMKKIGATYEGTFRNHYIMPDGSLRHSVWFSIIKEDWPQVKSRLLERLA